MVQDPKTKSSAQRFNSPRGREAGNEGEGEGNEGEEGGILSSRETGLLWIERRWV